jgi:hypothetical protein
MFTTVAHRTAWEEKSGWHQLFVASGFSGVEGAVDDWPGAAESLVKAMWSTKVADEEDFSNSLSDMDVVEVTGAAGTEVLTEAVTETLQHVRPSIRRLGKDLDVKDMLCIFLDCGETSFLGSLASEDDFAVFKAVVLESRSLLRVTPDNENPESGTTRGLLHTLRLEDTTKRLLHLDMVPVIDHIQVAGIIKTLAESRAKDISPDALRG